MENSVRPQSYRTILLIETFSEEIEQIRCMKCGTPVCSLKGVEVVAILGGRVVITKKYIEIMCDRCRIMYQLI